MVRERCMFLTTVFGKLMMRHTKNQVYGDRQQLITLPKKHTETIFVELSAGERRVYDRLHEAAKDKFDTFVKSGMAVSRTMQIMSLLLPLRQACSGGDLNVSAAIEQMKEMGNMALLRNRAAVRALAAVDRGDKQRKIATREAFNANELECTICLDFREDPLQTVCNHLFCGECIKSVLSQVTSQRVCPLCRHELKISDLHVPFLSAEERKAVEDEKKKKAEDEKRKKEEKLVQDRALGVVDSIQSIVMDSKLKVLIRELQRVRREDPQAKALVFTQFTRTIDWLKTALPK